MPDENDFAADLELREREASIARVRHTSRETDVFTGVRECVSCGDPIGEARQRALPGAIRCVDCQAGAEVRR